MNSIMKNEVLRILIVAFLITLITGIAVLTIGELREWATSIQFSDGFFWAGLIIISIGYISYLGYNQRANSWPPDHMDPVERSKLWGADTFHGKNIMIIFGISGVLLIGISILVTKLFNPQQTVNLIHRKFDLEVNLFDAVFPAPFGPMNPKISQGSNSG